MNISLPKDFPLPTWQMILETTVFPTLEVIKVPGDNKYHILVMPLLRPWSSPRFDTFGEAVDFFGQILEGVKFLHNHNIAHRFYPRTQRPPKYYLIDFGLTRIYATRDPPSLEPITFGADRSAPEFKAIDEYGPKDCDPFPIDVYTTISVT
ncbi:hypothetical protein FB451DRAFT_1369520 [Mycena latifolia]|nr:hypothetical protein FB451DRAFT_1369520 [Mycena latifolia]